MGYIKHNAEITKALLEFGKILDPAELFPVMVPEASRLVATDPYAFAMATCLDRGAKAELIWTIPYDIKNHLGHLDPSRIYKMSIKELEEMFSQLPRKPRYVNDAPRTIKDLTRIVVEECDGDAFRMWTGKYAADVKRTFISIHGVGEGIASMAVLLIEKAFPIRFKDHERPRMNIKADVNTMRVLYRLGVSDGEDDESALEAARRMNPEWPGELDAPLWVIGRKWCFAREPYCPQCPLSMVCVKRISYTNDHDDYQDKH